MIFLTVDARQTLGVSVVFDVRKYTNTVSKQCLKLGFVGRVEERGETRCAPDVGVQSGRHVVRIGELGEYPEHVHTQGGTTAMSVSCTVIYVMFAR